ncbi:MAG TPA: hypothetical protein EYQ54_11000 [Myxococcales bacterium]|jgi:hypothetical protein|nr:hypothetical protein [Myxococcales bacterium]HIL80809.1 hypothetical protein [Myxococcales bacterium]
MSDWVKRAFLLAPAAIAFAYGAVVGLEGVYVGLIASPDSLIEYGFEPQSAEWRFRSAGHFFWYRVSLAGVFTLAGLVLKRLLAAPIKGS